MGKTQHSLTFIQQMFMDLVSVSFCCGASRPKTRWLKATVISPLMLLQVSRMMWAEGTAGWLPSPTSAPAATASWRGSWSTPRVWLA